MNTNITGGEPKIDNVAYFSGMVTKRSKWPGLFWFKSKLKGSYLNTDVELRHYQILILEKWGKISFFICLSGECITDCVFDNIWNGELEPVVNTGSRYDGDLYSYQNVSLERPLTICHNRPDMWTKVLMVCHIFGLNDWSNNSHL